MSRGEKKNMPTVTETLALAEAWNERAALLATLAFELSDLFGATWSPLPAAYFVRRLAGGASAPNPELVDDVRNELMAAAEAARKEVARLLGSATDASHDASVPSLDGDEYVAPCVRPDGIRIPCGGDEIEVNPDCPPGRRRLGSNWTPPEMDDECDADGQDDEAAAPSQVASVTPLRAKRSRR